MQEYGPSGGPLNSAREAGGGLGIQTAALYIGGGTGTADVESYNGTSFTEVNNLNEGRGYPAGSFGTTTAGIAAGGIDSPSTRTANTESWDGTNWTEVNNLNTTRSQGAGFGTSNCWICSCRRNSKCNCKCRILERFILVRNH